MDRDSDTLFFRESKKLWMKAQDQGAPPLQDGEGLFAAVNEWRAMQSWPLCTDMLPVAPPICTQTAKLLVDTRSQWQLGILQTLKGVDTGPAMLRRALSHLCQQPETLLGQMALLLDGIVQDNLMKRYPHACQQCFARFDRLLKPGQYNEMDIHFLWADLVYYARRELLVAPEDKIDLNKRMHYIADKISDMLRVKNTEEKIKKDMIMPFYLSLTDGLLLLGEDKLLTRVSTLFNALEPNMLKISVPVQKLWAQCTNIRFLGVTSS